MDPISNMLTSIRNALAVGHLTVSVPFSNLKYKIAKILEKEDLIEKVEKKGKGVKKFLEITLNYLPSQIPPFCKRAGLEDERKIPAEGEARQGRPAISNLKRISKSGQRIYLPYKKIKKVRQGLGIAIISTSKGMMTDKEARKQKLGGEVICEIW